MLKSVIVNNYKSIKSLSLDLGRINVFIGENGCGKSNLLEALAIAAAAESGKLDNEFLASRGVRVTKPPLMKSCFDESTKNDAIKIDIGFSNNHMLSYELTNNNQNYSKWIASIQENNSALDAITRVTKENPVFSEIINDFINTSSLKVTNQVKQKIKENISNIVGNQADKKIIDEVGINYDKYINEEISRQLENLAYNTIYKQLSSKVPELAAFHQEVVTLKNNFKGFLIFSPENTALRNFYKEGQIEPLGINGEGLLKLLKVIELTDSEGFTIIDDMLRLLGWYKSIKIPPSLSQEDDKISIKDKYIESKEFDQRSANEGFLFILFYAALIVSKDTPQFFAIDNIDASLNPRLCTRLIEEIVLLSKKYDKQILLTTHNPATLDGLDLNDEDQKLFVVSRSRKGDTRIKLVPRDKYDNKNLKLSEAMLRGYLGGLPKGF